MVKLSLGAALCAALFVTTWNLQVSQAQPQPPHNLRVAVPTNLIGQTAWTLRLTDSGKIDVPLLRHIEEGNGGESVAVGLAKDGFPMLVQTSASGIQTARSAQPVAHAASVTSHSIEQVDTNFKRVTLTTGNDHPFTISDRIRVTGLGYPFDGEHAVTNHTARTIAYVVRNVSRTPTARGARRLPGFFSKVPSWHTRHGIEYPLQTFTRRLPTAWSDTEWAVAGWVRRHSVSLDTIPKAGIFAAFSRHKTPPKQSPSISLVDDSTLELQIGTGATASIGAAPLNQWVHLAAVRAGNEIRVYYNGVRGTSLTLADASLPTLFAELGFGYGSNRVHQAAVDLTQWSFHGRTLSDAEVSKLYNGGKGIAFSSLPTGLLTGLRSWYSFEEPYGDVLNQVAAQGVSARGRLRELGMVPWADGVRAIPFAPTAGAAKVIGTNYTTTPYDGKEPRRFVLTVTKAKNGEVAFYRDGELLSKTALAPMAQLDPEEFEPLPQAAPEAVALRAVLSDADVDTHSFPAEVKVSRTRGVGPLAVHFDATAIGGVSFRDYSAYEFQWHFKDSDSSPLSTTGLSYNRPTGFYVTHVFPESTTHAKSYDVYLSVRTSPFDKEGKQQPQRVLHSQKVTTITVDPWPSGTKTIYVAGDNPLASDANDGLSPSKPRKTLPTLKAKTLPRGPNVRILLERGRTIPYPEWEGWILENVEGPFEVGAYGDPKLPKPVVMRNPDINNPGSISIRGITDLRLVGLHLTQGGKVALSGRPDHVLLHDLEMHGSAQVTGFFGGASLTTIDKVAMSDITTDYAFWVDHAWRLGLTRIRLNGFDGFHVFRTHDPNRLYISGYHVTNQRSNETKGYGTCITPRHESRYYVLTDNLCSSHYPVNASVAAKHWGFMGTQMVLSERNLLGGYQQAGNRLTTRYNTIRWDYLLWDVDTVRANSGLADFVTTYRSRVVGPITREANGTSLYTQNEKFSSRDALASSTVPLSPPEIALLRVQDRIVDLGFVRAATGGRGHLLYNWQRSSNGGQSWQDIPGARTASLVDLDVPKGTHQYRVKVFDQGAVPAEAFSAPVSASVR